MQAPPKLARNWSTRAVWASTLSASDVEQAMAFLHGTESARIFRATDIASVTGQLGDAVRVRARATSGTDDVFGGGEKAILQDDVSLYCDANDVDLSFVVGSQEALTPLQRFEPASPENIASLLAGLRTLPLRIERQGNTARHIARSLAGHPCVASVDFAGLRTSPQYQRAAAREFWPDEVRFTTKESTLPQERFLSMLTLFHQRTSTPSVSSVAVENDTYILRCGLEDPHELTADLLRAIANRSPSWRESV